MTDMKTNQLSPFQQGVVGVQFLFVAFGATVLVPLLVGLDPAVALFTAGIGPLFLCFHRIFRYTQLLCHIPYSFSFHTS